MAIGEFDQSTTLAEDYLTGREGSVGMFHSNLMNRQRLGQAFFNALSNKDQYRLRGTIWDPFYKANHSCIEQAITYLLDTE